ncbi:MAG: 6,7-dimethyl-8-ribityllumazine synthase [Candidatus Eisenbacteria bacterium]|nr:6,7-dimethyl-8-ribityllumazine synthase [Candidatus Eisenbacteria bacterium]
MRPEADATGLRFCIVAAQWNESVVTRLVDGALAVLAQQGASDGDVEVRWVPGAYELPVAALWAASSGAFDAILAFGCVIRGETEHFRLVADAASEGLMRVALDTGVPVLNGVLAAYDVSQAESRSGGEHGNTGSQVALAGVRMARASHEAGAR